MLMEIKRRADFIVPSWPKIRGCLRRANCGWLRLCGGFFST
jgi:hypothetical protein